MESSDPYLSSFDFNCPQGIDPIERLELLQRIIDGHATGSEKDAFYQTVENCDQCECNNICQQHKDLKGLLKENVNKRPVPSGLIDVIRNQIQNSID